MARERPVGLIVDGYAGGSFFPPAFARHGHDVVHVQSTPELMPKLVAPHLDAYRDNIAHTGDYTRTLELARRCEPRFAIAGQEPGVPFADRLSEDLGLRTNGSAGSAARRNKYEMVEKLAAAGLHTADQHMATSPNDAIVWADRHGYWPCVVKPPSSAATDLVRVCEDPITLANAVAVVLGKEDVFGTRNSRALVQSFLDGDEFIVDSVSVDGHHFICGVWKYRKVILPNGAPIYDRDVLMHPDDCKELVAYTTSVLHVLGVANGAAHSEVKLTPDGPALVELGARLNGNMDPGFHDVCLGCNQADLTALAYTDPDGFLRTYGDTVYHRRQPAVVYNTATQKNGTVVDVDEDVVRRIAERPSVHEVEVKHGPGDVITATRDLMTSPLRVFLTDPDPAVLDADYEFVRSVCDQVYVLT